jgi:hypothetical protein
MDFETVGELELSRRHVVHLDQAKRKVALASGDGDDQERQGETEDGPSQSRSEIGSEARKESLGCLEVPISHGIFLLNVSPRLAKFVAKSATRR